ncbi:GNAT family N-acetyltransferase [Comamonas endophytica]|uniref:GNAT family N-acetyltransferase n=1 Tax=Comamonas endophytica TaxID=2949090 RepID=A0ABY6GAN5_9BURK|nr:MULTISPECIES: GNAT family N-acetyltransferase [unclassified Acidovorax]MCD2513865.1 GNAT family N-acetyltransferase [Acidovorax sp. D4N7]UYG52137.1 GNAT family N-acetyltransferase [Acidovorax sp. 5MLIR]
MDEAAIITRVFTEVQQIPAPAWNALLARQPVPTPFMRHEYFAALESSGSATLATGWQPCFVTLWEGDALIAACPVYAKNHSSGEYVFDWAWARAYAEHGLDYYPKAVIAVPFTPVPGTRLLARDAATRALLARTVRRWVEAQDGWSSLHALFTEDADLAACRADGWMQRGGVQFHWTNSAADTRQPLRDFEHFLAQLQQSKRKKIRQERRKVAEAGVVFRALRGAEIGTEDWDFFYRCYERTYLEHGNAPYLSREFFGAMAAQMPEHWLLFIAEHAGRRIAASLIALNAEAAGGRVEGSVAYGRYWGALERVDCLHFEACYYQPIAWCIAQGIARFEGGAQGEHKMARALLPTPTASAHWIAHPAFADAVDRFLEREGSGVQAYLEELHAHSPLRLAPPLQSSAAAAA